LMAEEALPPDLRGKQSGAAGSKAAA